MKLGCLPPKILPNQPMLAKTSLFMDKPPEHLDRSHIDPSPMMLGNDTIGDCTSAGIGNAIRAISSLGGFQTGMTDDDAIMFYEESAGYRGTPETDNGAIESVVLSYAMRNGYPVQNSALYPLWGTAPLTRENMGILTAYLGTAYLGIQLATTDMQNIAKYGADTVLELDNGIPGSAGGHCLITWDYTGLGDKDTVSLLTWGMKIKATNEWLDSRITEMHGLLFPQLIKPHGFYPTGYLLDELREQNVRFLRNE